MDATKYLVQIAAAMEAAKLEAILIGNAAAALHGVPVQTLAFDFLYDDTVENEEKIAIVANRVSATLKHSFPPLDTLYSLDFGPADFHVNFLPVAHGISSIASLRSRSTTVAMEGSTLLLASLADIIKSKREAGRPKDKAILDALEKTLGEIEAQAQQG